MKYPVAQTDDVERGSDVLPALLLGELCQQKRQLHVFECIEHGDEVVELKDESDVAGPPAGQRRLAEAGDLLAVDDDPTARRPVDAGDQIKQRRLARAGRTHQSQKIAARNVQRDPVQNGDVKFVALVDLANIADLNQSLHASSVRRSPEA